MKFNRFTKGSGVYTCDCCGRQTRDTGDGANNGLCSTCYDLAGYENMIMDGMQDDLTKSDIETIIQQITTIKNRGGNHRVWDDLLLQVIHICNERILTEAV